MSLYPNSHEKNQQVRQVLKSLHYSEKVIAEVINTISAMDRAKENLDVQQLTKDEHEKIAFIEAMYDEAWKVFYKYLHHSAREFPSQFKFNQELIEKYKKNICKYLYMLAYDNTKLSAHEEAFVQNSFWSIKRADKVLDFMARYEANTLWIKKNVLIGRDRTLNNPWHGMARDKRKEQSTAAFLQEQVWNEILHNAPVIVKVIDGWLELTDEMKARFESAWTHKQWTSFRSPIGSAQIATTWHQDTSKQ